MPSSVNFWVGLDVHKDSVTAAVFRNRDPEPQRVDRLPYDLHKIRRYFQRLQKEDNARACYAMRPPAPATSFSALSSHGVSNASWPPRR